MGEAPRGFTDYKRAGEPNEGEVPKPTGKKKVKGG